MGIDLCLLNKWLTSFAITMMPGAADESLLDNKVSQALCGKDFLFVEDFHDRKAAVELVARPDIMDGFKDGGASIIDLEILGGELSHISEVYFKDEISEDTMRFMVSDLHGATNHQTDAGVIMGKVADIIHQAKERGIPVSSTNQHFPFYTKDEFDVRVAYKTPLMERVAHEIDGDEGFSALKPEEKMQRYRDIRDAFNADHPQLHEPFKKMEDGRLGRQISQAYALMDEMTLQIEGPEEVRTARAPSVEEELDAFDVATAHESDPLQSEHYKTLSEPAKLLLEISSYMEASQETGQLFDVGLLDGLSDKVQSVIKHLAKMDSSYERFENDPELAKRMDTLRGDGKLIAVWGGSHFARKSGDVDAQLGEGRTLTIRAFEDEQGFDSMLSKDFKRSELLYGYDMSDAPNIIVDLSKGQWKQGEDMYSFSITFDSKQDQAVMLDQSKLSDQGSSLAR